MKFNLLNIQMLIQGMVEEPENRMDYLEELQGFLFQLFGNLVGESWNQGWGYSTGQVWTRGWGDGRTKEDIRKYMEARR